MIQPQRSEVEQRALVILVVEAVDIVPVYTSRSSGVSGLVRYAIVRDIILALNKVAQVQLGGSAETEGNRRSETQPFLLRNIPTDDIVFVCHQVDAQSDRRGDRLVDVGRSAEIDAVAQTEISAVARRELRNFADLIDGAAGRAAAKILRRRTFEHLD